MKDRRTFLKHLAGLTTGLMVPFSSLQAGGKPFTDAIGEVLPRRILGRTGKEVTMLGLGGYHIGWTTEKDAQATIEKALEGGIRFFDSAESYGPGTSEERLGRYLPHQHRDLIFLMTKTQGKDAETAKRHLGESLDRLKTDYLDLWQVHSVFTPEDVEQRIDKGVLEVVIDAKEQGLVRHIGFTGHQNPQAHLKMLEETAQSDIFETCQMPINPLDAAYNSSFVSDVFPKLIERNMGVLAMKTLADGRFFPTKNKHDWKTDNPVIPNRMSVKEALYFAWSLPISVLITGAENAEFLEEKIKLAKSFRRFSAKNREKLIAAVGDLSAEGKVEYYKKV